MNIDKKEMFLSNGRDIYEDQCLICGKKFWIAYPEKTKERDLTPLSKRTSNCDHNSNPTTKMKRKQGFEIQDDGTITTQSKMTTEDKIIKEVAKLKLAPSKEAEVQFFLLKALQQQKADLIEKIEKLNDAVERNIYIDDIISIIKE